jgi:hypothetical protein
VAPIERLVGKLDERHLVLYGRVSGHGQKMDLDIQLQIAPTVCTYLWQGATTQAPTLREIRGDDGSRVAVLDLMLEVPAKYVSALSQERRVVGFDWGVRSLITVSILEKGDADEPYQQVSRPLFLDTGGIDGRLAKTSQGLRDADQAVLEDLRAEEPRTCPLGLEPADPARALV